MDNHNFNASSAPTDSPEPHELTEKERATLRWEKRHARKARKIARHAGTHDARLQAHLTTDSATHAALNGITA